MERSDLSTIVAFGCIANTPGAIILKNGEVGYKGNSGNQKREDLHKVVAKIHAFSIKFINEKSLFLNTYDSEKPLGSAAWKKHKEHHDFIDIQIKNAKKSAISLKERLICHKRAAEAEIDVKPFLIARITNFFKRKRIEALDRLIKQLEDAASNFLSDPQIRPVVPLRVYTDQQSFKELLTANNFPGTYIDAIALFGEQQYWAYPVHLASEGRIESITEHQAVNNLIIAFLQTRYPKAVVDIVQSKHSIISTGLYFRKAIELATSLKHMDTNKKVKTYLKDLGFEAVLSPRELKQLVLYILDLPNIYLEGKAPLTNLDKELLGKLLNDYLCSRLDISVNYPDIHNPETFATTLANLTGGYKGSQMKKDRAKQLLRNLGYPDGSLLNDLAKFLEKSDFSLHNYALLSTDKEKRQFNNFVLDFLNRDQPFEILQATYRDKPTLIPLEDVIAAYNSVSYFKNRALREKTTKLIGDLSIQHSFSEKQLDRLTHLLIDHEFHFESVSMEVFNECFGQFLEELFPGKEDLIRRAVVFNPTDLDHNLLLARCEGRIEATHMHLLLGAFAPVMAKLEIFEDVVAYLERSQFHVVDVAELTSSEQTEFEFLLRRFLKERFPKSDGFLAVSTPEEFSISYMQAQMNNYYNEDSESPISLVSSVSMSPQISPPIPVESRTAALLGRMKIGVKNVRALFGRSAEHVPLLTSE